MFDSTNEDAPASPRRRRGDVIFAGLARASGFLILLALAGVAAFLVIEGIPGLHGDPSIYDGAPNFLHYVWPLVFGTVLAAVIAILIATPLAVGVALVISHFSSRRLGRPLSYLVDLLAAIPSVVYGLWGINYLAVKLTPGYAQ